ncbi:YbaB/EbfC family nucleoid-associated protein [Nonomuraea sp. NPDC050404]|uniref:YbaB/EbfC family nucleoid-associated protein n=1 Tax=Nonomuraea sp. NPDC050404 TaxID=3155783 RepID=UPI0033C9082F
MDFEQALGLDPERLAADADHLFSRLSRLPDEPATARAESPDGWVRVTYDSRSGVRDLRLDPRAMRLESAKLAETILDLIQRARQQAETEARDQAEHFVGRGNSLLTDRHLIADRLGEATGTILANLEQANTTIDRVRALLLHARHR